MILVTTGISGAPFDRLLREIDRVETDEEIVVQHGPSAVRPARGESVGFLTFAELEGLMASARIVVTHGGVGSVLVALRLGKQPVVVPRLPQFGEVVDDHQLLFGRRLAQAGLVQLVEDPADLPAVLADQKPRRIGVRPESQLTEDLGSYLFALTTMKRRERNGRGATGPLHTEDERGA